MGASRIEIAAFDFIDKVKVATTVDRVYHLLAAELGQVGYTNFLITDMPPPSLKLEGHLILNGWSDAWFDRYVEQGHYRFDPMAKRSRETVAPFFWDEVELGPKADQRSLRVMHEASECGLKSGFSVPIVGGEGEQSCVTMGGAKVDVPPRGREAIHLMSIYAHDQARALRREWTLAPKAKSRVGVLSAREREVLKWVAQGKTDWEIGEILKVSQETAFAHVRNSCRKLDAVTRTQAVVKAMMTGEISL